MALAQVASYFSLRGSSSFSVQSGSQHNLRKEKMEIVFSSLDEAVESTNRNCNTFLYVTPCYWSSSKCVCGQI